MFRKNDVDSLENKKTSLRSFCHVKIDVSMMTDDEYKISS